MESYDAVPRDSMRWTVRSARARRIGQMLLAPGAPFALRDDELRVDVHVHGFDLSRWRAGCSRGGDLTATAALRQRCVKLASRYLAEATIAIPAQVSSSSHAPERRLRQAPVDLRADHRRHDERRRGPGAAPAPSSPAFHREQHELPASVARLKFCSSARWDALVVAADGCTRMAGAMPSEAAQPADDAPGESGRPVRGAAATGEVRRPPANSINGHPMASTAPRTSGRSRRSGAEAATFPVGAARQAADEEREQRLRIDAAADRVSAERIWPQSPPNTASTTASPGAIAQIQIDMATMPNAETGNALDHAGGDRAGEQDDQFRESIIRRKKKKNRGSILDLR